MAEIDVTILDLFVRYGLPLLFGYIFIFHLSRRLFKYFQLKVFRFTLSKYWLKVNSCNKVELEQMFAPLHKLERKKGQKLRILEIGIGEGSNFAFYPSNCEVFAVDPEGAVEPGLKENISKYDTLELKSFKASGAEDMSHIDDNSMDAVVCTLVLCSVKNPTKVVDEVKRILKKDGTFVFWEHVYASNDKSTARMQKFLNEIWKIIFGGCHLTRKSSEYIQAAQFTTHDFSTINLPVASIISTTIIGNATK